MHTPPRPARPVRQALNKRFGFTIGGFEIMFNPESATITVGRTSQRPRAGCSQLLFEHTPCRPAHSHAPSRHAMMVTSSALTPSCLPHSRTGTKAPFRVSDLALSDDLELIMYVDKMLVEVFVSDLQAVCDTNSKWTERTPLSAYKWGASTTISRVDIWQLNPTTEGYYKARRTQEWVPPQW